MRWPRRIAIFSVVAVAISPDVARAQSAPGAAVQEKAAATVIEIPVNVVGKDGMPVLGLKLEDFTLTDDGKKQPINAVEVIDLGKASAATPSAAPSAAIPASARRLWLMVFDLSYASPSGLVRARDGARDFVTKSMRENDLAAVGTLSMETGWKLLVNFTHDRTQLAAAVDTLGLPALSLRSADPLAFAYSSSVLGSPESAVGPRGGGSEKELALLETLRDVRNLQKKATDDLERGRVVKLLNSLGGIGKVLDSVRGRKHVLYFSEGFETRLLSGGQAGGGRGESLQQNQATSALDATTTQGTNEAALSGEIWKVDSDARFGSSSLRDLLKLSLGYFQRSDSVLDAIDISGLRAEGDPSGPKRGSGTDALYTMSAETDGDFVRNANQLGSELQKVADRTSVVYLIAYQPKQLSKPGTFHKLKIEVKASGAKVIARSGYTEPRPYRSLTPLEQLLVSGDLLTGGGKGDEIPAHLLVAPFPSRAEEPQVPIVLEIPGTPLLAGDTGEKSAIQIYAYANDTAGTLADYLTSEMTLDLTKVRQTLESGGIKFYGTLYLPPGDYTVRALVRNASTGRAGVVSARVAVPRMPGGAPTVLAPLFADPTSKWAMVRGNPRADAPARTFEYPFAVAGDSFVPAALPTVSDGAATQVAVFTYNFGGDAKRAPLQVRGEIVGADGTARPVELTIAKESDRERGEGRKLLLSFKPAGLSPGRYALKVAVTDPASKTTGESSSVFEIR